MGSMIAQALAGLYPNQVRRLVLCASYPGNGPGSGPLVPNWTRSKAATHTRVIGCAVPADRAAAQNTYLAAVSSYPPASPAPADMLAAQRHAVDAWWNGTDRPAPGRP